MRGDCSYDKYEHDYIVYPYDVLIVERKKREDTAPVKRVELHLHTKLSSIDVYKRQFPLWWVKPPNSATALLPWLPVI